MPPFHPVQTKQKLGRLKKQMKQTMEEKRKLCGGGIYNGGLQLKLAGARTKVLSVGQPLQNGTDTVDTREGDVITGPVDFNALLLQGKEDDQSGNGDGAGESSGGNAESLSAQNLRSGIGKSTH